MHSTHSDYQHLHDLSRHTELLSSISQLLDWDQETYMPPDRTFSSSEYGTFFST